MVIESMAHPLAATQLSTTVDREFHTMPTKLVLSILFSFSLTVGCDHESAPASMPDSAEEPRAKLADVQIEKKKPSGVVQPSNSSDTKVARVGDPAPQFNLPSLDGKQVRLSDYRGKIVVLEWFNPECPFVRASHTTGSLVDAAKRAEEEGVVWLSINSSAPGKQGHGLDANRAGEEHFALAHPILLDEQGEVGKAYGAERTPHMFIIDRTGALVYGGAPDNSPDGEGKSPEGGTLIRYVDQALADLAAGRPVAIPRSKAYGCSVKY